VSGISRRFIEVEGRRVHYRRTGSGPPAVFLHASPANSEMVLQEMAAASAHFTCFAFDMPGFGNSDALPGNELEVVDIAAATAAAMSALDLPPCPVFGTHTGSAVGIELAVGWPDRVTGVVLDALPMFTDDEIAKLFVNFFVTFDPEPLGGHLVTTWMRFRDQFTWFPWTARTVARLNPVDRPTPAEIQHWVMMYYRARKTYIPAYRAACSYGHRGRRAAARLEAPAVFMASREDMLFGHLDRLPALKAGQRIERLPYDPPGKLAAIARFLREFPGGGALPGETPRRLVGNDPAVQFVDSPDGQIFVRGYGDPARPSVFLLHDAPGTGLALDGMARGLAKYLHVIVPDLPGTGESDAPAADRSVLQCAADALPLVADALSLDSYAIAGLGCGAAVAALSIGGGDPRVRAVIVEDAPSPDPAAAAAIAPDLPLSADGAHWIQAWLMVRDSQIYKPWFDGRVAAQRRRQGNFDADWLHDQTLALMKSRATYHRYPREAVRFDAASVVAANAAIAVAPDGGLAELVSSILARS
jgi:pimeloyl-ACP methyl ester carboxylesterase